MNIGSFLEILGFFLLIGWVYHVTTVQVSILLGVSGFIFCGLLMIVGIILNDKELSRSSSKTYTRKVGDK